MKHKISILVPIYNVEQYLQRCIDSVLSQSLEDWELILVDDGSPDGCPAICDKNAEKDTRIKVVHKENGGLPSARLAGFEEATGEYLVFLDSDDWLLPDALQILYDSIASEGGFDIVKARPMRHNGTKSWIETYPVNEGILDGMMIYGEAIIMNDIHPYLHSGIYKRELFSKEVFTPIIRTGISFGEDWFANTLIIDKVKRVKVIDHSVYAYFVNSKSTVGTSILSHNVSDAADTFLYDYLASVDDRLSQIAFNKNYIGALNDLFKPEVPFEWRHYNMVRDFFRMNPEYKERANRKFIRFINVPVLYYPYAMLYRFLYKRIRLKGKKRKMV